MRAIPSIPKTSLKALYVKTQLILTCMSKIETLKTILAELSKDYIAQRFKPLLEADISGYLYHLWISKLNIANKLHLDTRICAVPDQRFDFVIGEINYNAERPCIKPELVIEVKLFPFRMTPQQHRVHYLHVIEDDIPKLARLKEPLDDRYALLFDEVRYLEGFDRAHDMSRLSRVIKTRDSSDQRIHIIYMKKEEIDLELKFY
jgi:hypothetical protein